MLNSLQSGGSQPPGHTWFLETFVVFAVRLLVPDGWRPGVWPDIPQCIGRPTSDGPSPGSTVPRLRSLL